jgi:hypothetical protein
MKKLVFVLCVAVALFSVPQWAVALDMVYVAPGYGTRQVGIGGEFTLTASGSLTGTFQTFCIELGEYLSANATYNYVINSAAVQGGVGGPHPDPISKGTAYLFYNFAKGTLAGYDYAGTTKTQDLQNAIWYLEEEIGDPGTNEFLTAVYGLYGNLAGARADANGLFGVAALNLSRDGDPNAQDVLVVTPEPLTMILFGLGLIGLAALTRKE